MERTVRSEGESEVTEAPVGPAGKVSLSSGLATSEGGPVVAFAVRA